MMRAVLDTLWVATYELGEAVRTRLFQLVILAYLGGIGFSVWLFTKILSEAENRLAETLGVPATSHPGAMLPQLLQNGEIRDLLAPIVGGESAAAALLSQPALGLWVGIFSMGLLPAVMVFTASGTVSAEVASRSIRFLLVRTGRLEIAAGKLLGQMLLGAVAALLGVVLAWVLGLGMMTGNPPVDLAVTLLTRCLWSCIFGLPFLGLALGSSLLFGSPNGARVAAALAFFGMPALNAILSFKAGPGFVGQVCDLLTLAIPTRYWNEFWSTDFTVLATASARSLLLATLFFAFGFARFQRRDL